MRSFRPQTRARALVIASLVAGALAIGTVSLLLGSNLISPVEVLRGLFAPDTDADAIVWGSRVPRTVLGIFVGFCLGIAGAVMQGQTRNPLADPGIFGVSAGASLAVVIGVYVFGTSSIITTLWLALVGAIVASVVVFSVAALGRGLASPVPLAIAGSAVSALLVAFTSLLVLSDETTLAAYRIWVVGSLSGRSLDGLAAAAVFAIAGLALALFNIRSLNNLALGTELAHGLGENLIRARLIGLGAITLLTASAVAITGPIGFVGLTAPHIARSLVGGNHAWLLPASGLIGATVLLACDVVGRLIGGSAEVPVGVVLAVLGGIVFIAIVRRGKVAAL
ncbi:iron complex transport system permease protein [Microbacterium endophyticum]|uniref:Iron complex transport system permease protein n=1 Tax=Microbacterium endophyticum TaxID=1526412 RepID=A0A7W4V4E5_9MICO|nr:iron ABC transporter permease [Microbacterium endophyticum]MBB2976663.1 iron complex transport system permease protein [Microbacterium endophyticum]NIK37624.1 iron complex transport system permease protein [Microbacterium endophyticum]